MTKIKIKPWDSLSSDEKNVVIYYETQMQMLTLRQILHKLKNEIGANQKRKVQAWINSIEKSIDREYELEKIAKKTAKMNNRFLRMMTLTVLVKMYHLKKKYHSSCSVFPNS